MSIRAFYNEHQFIMQGIKWMAERPQLAVLRSGPWWRPTCAALAALNIIGTRTDHFDQIRIPRIPRILGVHYRSDVQTNCVL